MSRRFKWIPLDEVLFYEPEAVRSRVSEVARSPRGFLRAYEKARGDPNTMGRMKVPGIKRFSCWDKRRDEFIARHMKQYEKRKTRRRWLALVMWAYKPPGTPPASVDL